MKCVKSVPAYFAELLHQSMKVPQPVSSCDPGFHKRTLDCDPGFHKITLDCDRGFQKSTLDCDPGFKSTWGSMCVFTCVFVLIMPAV